MVEVSEKNEGTGGGKREGGTRVLVTAGAAAGGEAVSGAQSSEGKAGLSGKEQQRCLASSELVLTRGLCLESKAPWANSSHVIFLGLVVLKISVLFINIGYMFVIPFPLFTFRGIFVISIVISTRQQIHCPIRRLMSVIRMVFHHCGSVPSVLLAYLLLTSCCMLPVIRLNLEC